MRVLLASSEVHPFSKTGGLADMVGALGKALARAGHAVAIATPLYQGVRERFPNMRRLDLPLDSPLGMARVRGEVWHLDQDAGPGIYFIEQPEFYQRSTLYQKYGVDYDDNAERFMFLAKAVAHLALHLRWRPEILHLHDWQTAFAALLLHHQRLMPGWAAVPRTCLTIHNLAYQGVFPLSQYALSNLPWDYFHPEGVEFFGKVNYLKAGIAYADTITTVSPRYAREITTEEYGCGLDGLLRRRYDALTGTLNGVDYDEWNTTQNPYIASPYSVNDLAGKESNKVALQQEFGLPAETGVPLFGSIGRLAEQKGVDILLAALRQTLATGYQLVLLGTGSPAYERAYQDLARQFPKQVAVQIGFDQGLSHRIEAGADFFLMPSRFEPCGLNQMYSLRYGTVPIVRSTGGLDDTVVDVRDDVYRANGIKFGEYSGAALAKAIYKALVLYGETELLKRFRRNGMEADFSWERTATDYLRVYEMSLGQSRDKAGEQVR